MLFVNRTEHPVMECNEQDFSPATADEHESGLDMRVSLNPVIEMFADKQDGEINVSDAAKMFHKSPRQIQRLLKEGRLLGRKVDGPKGPEWRVAREQPPITRRSSEDEIAERNSMNELMMTRMDILARELQVLTLKAERFEAAIARVESLSAKVEQLCTDLKIVREQGQQSNSAAKELYSLKDQQSSIDFVTTELREHREMLRNLEERTSQTSWWKKTFAV
ncbi:MAG TPA: hypothetical protein V6C89_10860 [Drouetiella sp.]|jgi:hypothetical protein